MPWNGAGGSGTVQIVVESVNEGELGDFEPPADYAGYLPYFVQVTVTGGEGSEALANDGMSGGKVFDVIDASGQVPIQQPVLGGISECKGAAFAEDFGGGMVHEDCHVALVSPDAGEITGVIFDPAGPGSPDYSSMAGAEPITWN